MPRLDVDNPVTHVPAADAATALAHFERLLAFETDCWDVHAALEAGRGGFVLIDVRGLSDRLGSLGALSMSRCDPRRVGGYRVAVVDAMEHDAYYALHEMAARAQGYVLRCFSSMAEAVRWLRSAPGRD